MLSKQVLKPRFWTANRKFWLKLSAALAFNGFVVAVSVYDTKPKHPMAGYRSVGSNELATYMYASGGQINTALFTVSGNTTLEDPDGDVMHINGNVVIDGNLTVH